MNQSLIIKSDLELDVQTLEENQVLFIFIDCYMSTKLYNFLVEQSKLGKIEIFIRNIGKVTEKSDVDERKEIIENYYENDVPLDVYRKYILSYPMINKYIDANVAIVSDEIQFSTFENTTNLFYVNELTIDSILEKEIDLFLFITSWAGLYKEYHEMDRPARTKIFESYIKKAKQSGVPIAFYSKEDPPNFDQFKNLTKTVDMIFTSSVEKIPEYKKINKKAEVLNFTYGINPSGQAPSLAVAENDAVLFAGTWFNGKYYDRMHATQEIFEYIDANNLDFTFYNRNFYRNIQLFKLPGKYKKYEKPALPYATLVEKYKQYKYHINLNSVTDDQTMFAVRVLELQGLGKKIISNYSLPIYVDYPNISIFNGQDFYEFSIDDKILGIRNTFQKNSVFDFWEKILNHQNLSYLLPLQDEIEFSEKVSYLQQKDIKIAAKYSYVEFYQFTDDKTKYYTILQADNEKYHAKNLNTSNGLVLYLPDSKYYNYNRKLLSVNISNYKQALNLNPDEYIILLEDDIINSNYINKQFTTANFKLINDFQLRERVFPKQNMTILSLINLLHYIEIIDIVKLSNGEPVTIGTIKKDSLAFQKLVTDYKKSIQMKRKIKLDIEVLLFDIN